MHLGKTTGPADPCVGELPPSLLSAIRRFRESLEDELYHVEHDIDMDGFASGIIATVALRRLGYNAYPYATERSKTFVPDSGSVLFTDIALNNEPTETVDAAIERGVRVYAIDHHPWTPGYETKLHAVLNPHYIPNVPQPSRWNAGFLTYLTFRDVAADYDWLAAVSVYTDTCVAPWNQHLVDRFGYDVVRRAGDLLTAYIATTDDLSELDYVLLNEIHNIKDVISDERFIRAEREFESTVEKYVNDPKSHALLWDETRKVAVIETREAYLQINSVVSTRISLLPRFRDWIIVVIGKDPDSDGYKASIRCQNWEKRGHMGELARKICERIGGKGGGHPPAAGLRIPRGKKEALVEALQSLL